MLSLTEGEDMRNIILSLAGAVALLGATPAGAPNVFVKAWITGNYNVFPSCPVDVEFTGQITVSNVPAAWDRTIQYHWVTTGGPGYSSAMETIKFPPGATTQSISTHWSIAATGNYTMQLQVTSPVTTPLGRSWSRYGFAVTCPQPGHIRFTGN